MKQTSKITTVVIYSSILGLVSAALDATVLGDGPHCRRDKNDQASFEQTAAGGRDLQTEIAAQLEGKQAPDFTLESIDGSNISLSELKGNTVVLDFWATWCGPCRRSLPELNQLYKDKAGENLKVFAINIKEDKEQVESFLKSAGLSLPVLLDKDGQVAKEFGVKGIPQTVVIDKQGAVKKVFVGAGPGTFEQLRQQLEGAANEKTVG